MKRMRYWLASKKLLMAQLHDLQRQLQEAWNVSAAFEEGYNERGKAYNNLTDQLHRVARERDQERKLRLEAEDRLLDRYLENAENEEE